MGLCIEQNVQRLIDSKGWTIYRLSKNSGVSLTVLYSLGKKKSGPTAETLIKIAKALDVTVDELVREEK
ncbi:MAG: helix-turn-helix transcriptional regulator [Desulfitobacterium hafniense]|nr:helix-turn-helix transcriptional regulator [Desulfitobacterium hafniense]